MAVVVEDLATPVVDRGNAEPATRDSRRSRFNLMKDWKKIAEGNGLDIPALERIIASLDGLEAAFRPLVDTIPHDVEPAIIFHVPTSEEEQ